jgi:glycosyltransferase involved in cell wall biosynthesis
VISVVMPAHNEQDYLAPAVEQVVLGLRARSQAFEVLVCENGSTDATAEVAAGLAERFPEVRTVSSPLADYGKALRTGFLATAGDLVVNFDVDYIDLEFLDNALAMVEGPDRPAVIVATKRSPGAHDDRGAGRRLVTAVFSLVLHHGFGLSVSDTHGMKLLRRADVADVIEVCRFGTDLSCTWPNCR